MISNIKELIQKITESENNISFVEKKELIENSIKNLYIEQISHINDKKINDSNILIKSEKNNLSIKSMESLKFSLNIIMFVSVGNFLLSILPLYFNSIIPLNNFNINILLGIASPLIFFGAYVYKNKIKNTIKKQNDDYYDETSLLPTQYMHKHYKNSVKDVSVKLIKELESITEPELQQAKKHISDYLVVNTFEFEEEHSNNIFYKISNDIKEKIFIPEEPLRSKKLLSTEFKNRIQNNKITITNIEEIKLKLINDVDNKVISK